VKAFTAAKSCSGSLPPIALRRTYVATFQPESANKTYFMMPLSGADLFPSYDKMSATVSNDGVRFYVQSWDASNWWLEDDPIIDRLDSSTFVSFDGSATIFGLTSTASLTATFDGTIAFCAAAQDPSNKDFPLRCGATDLVECKSSQHQMTLTRR